MMTSSSHLGYSYHISASGPATAVGDVPGWNRSIGFHLYTLWLFTRSDIKTAVLPQLAFAISAVTSARIVSTSSEEFSSIFFRLPHAIVWIWLNLLRFNVSNQRRPESVREDALNKPWRPLPSGRLSTDEARWLDFILIPLAPCVGYALCGFTPSLLFGAVCVMYNDFNHLNEQYFVVRNVLNGVGYALLNWGTTVALAGVSSFDLTGLGWSWLAITAAITLTTIHLQDLPDIAGDRARGRRTMPMVLGEMPTRVSGVVGVVLWSMFCVRTWKIDSTTAQLPLYAIVGSMVVLLFSRSDFAHRMMWKLWCGWMIVIFTLPALA